MKRFFAWLLCLAMLVSLMAMPAMATEQPTVFRIDGTGIVAEDDAVITTQAPFGKGGTTARYAPSVPKFVPAMQSNAGQEEGFSTQSTQISRAEVYVSTSGTLPYTLTNGNMYIIDTDYTHNGNLTVQGTVTLCLGKYHGAGVTFTLNGMIKLLDGAVLKIMLNNGTTGTSSIVRHTSHDDQLVYVTGGSKLYVYGGTSSSNRIIFDGNSNAALDPLIYVTSDGANAVYMENCVVRNAANRSTHNNAEDDEAKRGLPGGGICMYGGTLYLGYGVSITNNIARMGAGLYLSGESVVKSWTGESGDPAASKPKIYNNSATIGDGYGGGIFLGSKAVYSAYLGYLENNKAFFGGGLYLGANATWNPKDVFYIRKNSASQYGGGIYMGGSAVYSAALSYIEANSAVSGGGLYITEGSTWKPSGNAYIRGNNASKYGGGIYLTKGTINIASGYNLSVGTSGNGNKAAYGGGIYVVNGTMKSEGTLAVRYNTATSNGGGLMVEGGTLSIGGTQNVQITYNEATNGYGGGIVVYGSNSALNDTSTGIFNVSGNTAKTYGGGIYMNSGKIITNGMTVGNSSETGMNRADWGGGICIWSGALNINGPVNVQYNKATTKGGGVYVYNGIISCDGAEQLNIYNNTANYGGGMYLGGSTDTATDIEKKTITFKGAGTGGIDVCKNTGNTNGGGIMAENCNWNCTTPLYVSSNITSGYGGGLYLNSWINPVTITATNEISVCNNTATGTGGGICMKGGTFTNKGTLNVNTNTSTNSGGGLLFNSVTFTNSGTLIVDENKAEGNGGGLFITNSTVELIGATSISENMTASNGGGVYVSNSTLRNEGMLSLSYNTASDNGGGLLFNSVTFTNNGTLNVNTNTATNSGGLYLSGGTFTNNDTLNVNSNMAASNGGGLLINGGNVYLNKTCVIEMNTAQNGAGIYQTNGTTLMTGTIELRRNNANHNGAGIYMNNGALDVSGNVKLVENKAMANGGGLCVNNGTVSLKSQSNFELNSAANGGGIYQIGGTINLYNTARIRNNTVNRSGGGLYIANGTICANEAPLIIEGNKAEIGGGVYTNGGTTIFSANTTITSNTAMKNGGGIYIAGSGTLTMLNFKKSPIRKNVASVAGNDIYAVGNTTTVNISATMDGAEEEYWFADYADGDANYPGQPVFASAENAGRYNADSTIEHARRSFGAAFEEAEPGAKVAANACLALTLGINLHKVCAHTNTKEVVVTAATCTEPGEASILCADCGEALGTKTIPAPGHTEVADSAVAPTCVSAGLTEGSHCAVCKVVIVAQTTIPALDHAYEGVITTEPTCHAGGVMTYTCSACDDVYTEEIPQLTHNYECVETSAPTCEASGVKTYTCTHCGDSYTEAISATGHTAEIDPAVAATCTTDGLTEGSHCSVCKAIIVAQEVIPAFGHSHEQTETVAPTCTEDGVATYACANCGDAYTKPIPALGHTFVNGVCTVCGTKEPEPDAVLDPTIKVYHSLNLASDISVNFAVPKSYMAGYNMDTVYMECTMDLYSGNEVVGTKTYKLLPTEVGSYYYFVMSQLTALQMNDRMIAVLHGVKNGQKVYSAPDNYSIADYAYSALNNEAMSLTLKNLCADLLRYGAIAQSYKGYRTDALADSGITKEQEIHLSDLDAITFGNVNNYLKDVENPSVSWVGKTLSMESKVSVKYVINLSNFSGNRENLSMHISYIDAMGGRKDLVLTDMETYSAAKGWYSFSFSGLLVAELRTVLSAQVYDGDTPVSETLLYSPDTYGNNQDGLLDLLCRAMFAYSDSAKAFFVN